MMPDIPEDSHGVYSGSAIENDGVLHIFYTGNVKMIGDYDYVKAGSMNIVDNQEWFLYQNIVKTEKPKDNDKSSGGSSTHTSSSGSTHGGGGFKF